MGDRGTEDGHDAVADVPVDVPAVLLDDPVDAVEEAPLESVDLLGVELVAQRRVAGEIGEEHRDLPPLSLHCERGRYRCSRHLLRCPDMQGSDGVDQLQPMSERQAKLFEVLIPERRQDIAANSVVAERLLVLLQAEAPQPGRHIHYLPPYCLLPKQLLLSLEVYCARWHSSMRHSATPWYLWPQVGIE